MPQRDSTICGTDILMKVCFYSKFIACYQEVTNIGLLDLHESYHYIISLWERFIKRSKYWHISGDSSEEMVTGVM